MLENVLSLTTGVAVNISFDIFSEAGANNICRFA
jgi:hypothetical protein